MKHFATFGAGCYWGTEHYFKKNFKKGILSSNVGFMGGNVDNPTYRNVCNGNTGHAEVAQFEYDPSKVKYEDLVHFLFRIHDPTTLNQQGNDKGTQYRSVIFYHDDEQKEIAIKKKAEIQSSGVYQGDILTEISPASTFYKAQDDHQDYLNANPGGYCNHRIRW